MKIVSILIRAKFMTRTEILLQSYLKFGAMNGLDPWLKINFKVFVFVMHLSYEMIAGVILTFENLTMHIIQSLLTNIWSNVLIL